MSSLSSCVNLAPGFDFRGINAVQPAKDFLRFRYDVFNNQSFSIYYFDRFSLVLIVVCSFCSHHYNTLYLYLHDNQYYINLVTHNLFFNKYLKKWR